MDRLDAYIEYACAVVSCIVCLQQLKDQNKSAVYVGESFIYGLSGSNALIPKLNELEGVLQKIDAEHVEEEKKKAEKKAKDSKESESKSAAPAPVAASASDGKAKQLVRVKDQVASTTKDKKGKKVTEKISGVQEFTVFTYVGSRDKVLEWFKAQGFVANEQA